MRKNKLLCTGVFSERVKGLIFTAHNLHEACEASSTDDLELVLFFLFSNLLAVWT